MTFLNVILLRKKKYPLSCRQYVAQAIFWKHHCFSSLFLCDFLFFLLFQFATYLQHLLHILLSASEWLTMFLQHYFELPQVSFKISVPAKSVRENSGQDGLAKTWYVLPKMSKLWNIFTKRQTEKERKKSIPENFPHPGKQLSPVSQPNGYWSL